MGLLCPHCRSRFADEDVSDRCPHDNKRLVPDRTGQIIADRYTLRELLGVGGMDSSVWLAWQTSTQRTVAVKVLPPVEGDAADRFARGGRIASNLNHPNITTVHDYGRTESGELYLVMELLEGVTLYRALRKTPFPLERTVHVIDQVLRALGHAHRRSVVHRDIKLSNLFLTPRDDDQDFVKVLDFGIARFIEDNPEGWGDAVNNEITTTRQLCGTPQYMAPEQIGFGKVDHRADLYAVGVATYRMITGRFPFQGSPHDQFRAHLQSKPPPISQVRPDLTVPEEIEAWIMQALEKLPDNRFASAEEMRTALRSIRKRLGIAAGELEDSSVRSAPHSRSSSASWAGHHARDRTTEHMVPEPPPKKRTWIWVLICALLLFVVLALLLTRQPEPPRVTALSADETATREPSTPTADDKAAAATDEKAPPDGVDAPEPDAPDTAEPAAADPGTAEPNAAEPAAPEPPATRSVTVKSRPLGATVSRDGEVLGETPLPLDLAPGDYVFKVSRRGYRSESVRVDVSGDSDAPLAPLAVLRRSGNSPPRPAAAPPKAPEPVEPPPEAPANPEDVPAAEPVADAPPEAKPEKKSSVRMQLLDEDEARAFDVAGDKPAGKPKADGPKPSVELIE